MVNIWGEIGQKPKFMQQNSQGIDAHKNNVSSQNETVLLVEFCGG
jgi:hypothetical protein